MQPVQEGGHHRSSVRRRPARPCSRTWTGGSRRFLACCLLGLNPGHRSFPLRVPLRAIPHAALPGDDTRASLRAARIAFRPPIRGAHRMPTTRIQSRAGRHSRRPWPSSTRAAARPRDAASALHPRRWAGAQPSRSLPAAPSMVARSSPPRPASGRATLHAPHDAGRGEPALPARPAPGAFRLPPRRPGAFSGSFQS